MFSRGLGEAQKESIKVWKSLMNQMLRGYTKCEGKTTSEWKIVFTFRTHQFLD